MTAMRASGARFDAACPTRSSEGLSSTKACEYRFGTCSGRRIPSDPGRKRSESGRGESRTTSPSLPRCRRARRRPRQDPTASPSGSTCAVIRYSGHSSRKGSKPSKEGSLIARLLLDLAQELIDARAGLDRVIDQELDVGHDAELQPGRQETPEVGRRLVQLLEHVRLVL